MTEKEHMRLRLFECIDECGETLKEVAKATGTNYSYLSYLRNKNNFDISAHFIASFCTIYKYSPTWIILGTGDKKITGDTQLDRIESLLDDVILKLLDDMLTPPQLQGSKNLKKQIADALKRRN